MDLFEAAVTYTLVNEGGYGWNPDDAGGPTNFGITQHDYSLFLGRPATPAEVRDMPKADAEAIYRRSYWPPIGGDSLTQQAVATCMFDSGVLYGVHTGAIYGQRAANACGASLSEDGAIGPMSLAALNQVDPRAFINAYHGLIVARINAIVANNPSQAKFRAGWMNRANRLLTLV